MKYVGAHVSAVGGVENAPLNAHKLGATAFALFTKNQERSIFMQHNKGFSFHIARATCSGSRNTFFVLRVSLFSCRVFSSM